MKISNKLKSIRFRLFSTLCVSIILIIITLVIINNVVLETFYLYSKTHIAIGISKSINEYYNGAIEYNINDKLRELERNNNIDILILDEELDVVYCNNSEIIDTINSMSPLNNFKNEIIFSKDNIIVQNVEASRNNQYLLLTSYLDNDYIIYIN